MKETTGNIWDHLGKAIICITTNGHLMKNGEAVLGRGCARQAREHFPDLPLRLGGLLSEGGNHVHAIGDSLVSFPVEESPWATPDLRLIRRSAGELRALADREGWTRIIVPRPGCGGGGLAWQDVRPLLADILDDRFTVITAP
ncbi:ADP-ribose-binding protein [Geobacter hydrogenophilus]|uniref:ADP-ribose-binding protein n=1 Tax=Geobacter hydrogenophilus TaxID=40983 RepID=A0A9W6G3W7_9BACT|nr:ADP-ribose-binding protein [Geobacter hydrogenophilus]MBT0892436.1 ADP-ribose-binding protein [Geobacter hydrogenophilus]GLI39833.1 ADP-ribose-binding protein [Geobacter hydrogenophilus]